MKMKMLLLLLALSLIVSCTTAGGGGSVPREEHCSIGEASQEPEDAAIFFFTKDTGIVAIETVEGLPFLTIPRLRTFMAPMHHYVSKDGEPIFTCPEEGVNVKIYEDRLLWMRWGKAEYTAWNFSESPKDFYLKF